MGAACLLAACGTSSAQAPHHASTGSSGADRYGSLPTYLPSDAITPDAELTGTAARPALTVQGDSVKVLTAAGAAVRATVVGPAVPGEGLPYVTEATTCTWTVTLVGGGAPVPVRASDFSTIDHLGAVFHPRFLAGQPRPKPMLEPGEHMTFELRAVMPAGEGLMRWAPGNDPILASWDFVVEND